MPSLVMEDHLGIVYVIETAQQFWSGGSFSALH
jgi:hypothetical protein